MIAPKHFFQIGPRSIIIVETAGNVSKLFSPIRILFTPLATAILIITCNAISL